MRRLFNVVLSKLHSGRPKFDGDLASIVERRRRTIIEERQMQTARCLMAIDLIISRDG